MAVCPQCQSWLRVNPNNRDWVKCDQGHHYKNGTIKIETMDLGNSFAPRSVKCSTGDVLDVRTLRWVNKPNWPTD
jgi:hypothetical protein